MEYSNGAKLFIRIKNMIEKKKFKDSFHSLVDKCAEDKVHVGEGNPDAKILIVGKEAPIAETDCNYERYVNNAKYWKEGAKEKISDQNYNPTNAGCTFRKYQKLNDFIWPDKKLGAHKFSFKENVFFAEMSDLPAMNTAKAKKEKDFKERLEKREEFFKSDFIQQFPVVILACGDYIKNNDSIRQIDDIFGVRYIKKGPHIHTLNRQSFWVHYNADQTKLVIHTRQLSGNVTNVLLEDMGKTIRQFLDINQL